MPEYLAPGVYVEETSFRSKSIEGVGTSTTAFVGPTRRGPIGGTPEMITSLPEFEQYYGSMENLGFGSPSTLNYVAHAARAYFDNGGSRLYVMRTASGAQAASGTLVAVPPPPQQNGDQPPAPPKDCHVILRARFPGAAYNGTAVLAETRRPATVLSLGTAPDGSMVEITDDKATTRYVKANGVWCDAGNKVLSTANANDADIPGGAKAKSADLLSASIHFVDADGYAQGWEDLGYGAAHPRYLGHVLAQNPARRAEALTQMIYADIGADASAFDLRDAVIKTATLALTGGTDGSAPVNGTATTAGTYAAALDILSGLEDVSIVATPGASAFPEAQAIQATLIAHAEKRRAYRIAVLDAQPGQIPGDMRVARGKIDSRYAALYYPWVVAANPLARPGRDDIPKEITLPPSGYVCGIYARNDVQRGVHKAPANEVVSGALRFETDINFAQQELLNPLGVNCLRFLSGRGYRLWGARLASSDPEWKYVSDRRYFNYLESSIDRGTQWAVFEPNGERLWANVRQTISDFLYSEWKNGALLGGAPEQAYFVRCDRSTMTQADLDAGRLVASISIVPAVSVERITVVLRLNNAAMTSRLQEVA
jgi:phage tail sheath protein FI